MQDTPDVDLIRTLKVKHQIGISFATPKSKPGQIQFMRIAQRSGARLALNVAVSLFERIDERQNVFRRILQVVIDGFLNILVRPLAANDVFHRLPGRRFLIPARSDAK